jgi:hypothetical protein
MDFFSIASNGLWSVSTITSRIGIDGNAHNHKLLQAFLFQSVSSSADMMLTLSTHTLLDDHFEARSTASIPFELASTDRHTGSF